ncbi:MAG: restriction endonuclease [Lysobacteraceae bacterium]
MDLISLQGTANGGGSDGGVDVVLRRGHRTWLVQCKHWKGRVGVKPLREMIGLLEHHQAERGVIIASGGFTKPAWEFVQGKRLSLVDGKRLLAMLDENAQD